MKKKNIIIVLLLFLLLFTGCTTVLKDKNNKPIKNPETGQNLTKNILCQPTNEKIISIYRDNKVEINSLPKCADMKVFDTYEGIWTTVFVRPLAWLLVQVGEFLNNYGLSIIIVTLLLRLIMMPVTKKTALQSENMALAQPEINKLEKKYKDKQNQEEMMQKSQEMMAIYKKYKINPMTGCLFALIQIPLFFAFYEALNRLPVIFESTFLVFQLGTTPLKAISNGNYLYLILVVLVLVTTYFSFKTNNNSNNQTAQAKQMKMMMNIMIVIIGFTALSLPSGLALYWIFNSSFTILQNILVKRRKK